MSIHEPRKLNLGIEIAKYVLWAGLAISFSGTMVYSFNDYINPVESKIEIGNNPILKGLEFTLLK